MSFETRRGIARNYIVICVSKDFVITYTQIEPKTGRIGELS